MAGHIRYMEEWKETATDFFGGCISGWTQVTVMQPFELVKVRLINQSLLRPEYSGIWDCFHKTFKEEGPWAFYKGSLTPFLGVGFQVAMQFATNELVKRMLIRLSDRIDSTNENLPLELVFAAGLATGVPSAFIVTPVDHTRILIQLRGQHSYSGSLSAGLTILKKYGLRGLYLGFYPTLLREVIAMGVYFTSYELGLIGLVGDIGPDNKVTLLSSFLAGGLAGSLSWLFTYPIDYVKTLVQSDNLAARRFQSASDCARQMYREEGYRTFFKGLGVTMLRSFPVNGLGLLAFEKVMKLAGKRDRM